MSQLLVGYFGVSGTLGHRCTSGTLRVSRQVAWLNVCATAHL